MQKKLTHDYQNFTVRLPQVPAFFGSPSSAVLFCPGTHPIATLSMLVAHKSKGLDLANPSDLGRAVRGILLWQLACFRTGSSASGFPVA